MDQALSQALADMAPLTGEERLEARYMKFRRMGEEGTAFTDTAAAPEA